MRTGIVLPHLSTAIFAALTNTLILPARVINPWSPDNSSNVLRIGSLISGVPVRSFLMSVAPSASASKF
jgi:hypothetical protein